MSVSGQARTFVPVLVPTPPLPELVVQQTDTLHSCPTMAICPIVQSITPPIVILDFDDTCFCTSLIIDHKMDVYNLSPVLREAILKLDILVNRAICSVLSRCAIIYMVTNAETRWIVGMVNAYMPLLSNVIFRDPSHRVRLMSAADLYGWYVPSTVPFAANIWKRLAYEQIIKQVGLHVPIISIGDGDAERDACDYLRKMHQHQCVSHVELLKKPSLVHITTQWLILDGWMPYLLTMPDNLNRRMIMTDNHKWPVLVIAEPISANWIPILDQQPNVQLPMVAVQV